MPEIDEKAFRKHLEWLVDLLPDESAPYFEKRPRYVHAVLVLSDDAREGEIIKVRFFMFTFINPTILGVMH
jgi:hypothetical protein